MGSRTKVPRHDENSQKKLLKAFGAKLHTESIDGVYTVSVSGGYNLKAANIEIPADPSSAIFPVVAALIVPKSSITLRRVGFNPFRVECFKVLEQMGGKIKIVNNIYKGNEQIVDIEIESSELKGIEIEKERSVLSSR